MRVQKLLIFVITTFAQWLAPAPVAARSLPDVPAGRPVATINLATDEGAALVRGQWRYSDTKIIETRFKAPGPDKQPTGEPIKTYDYTPHAGGADFDDSQWQAISASSPDFALRSLDVMNSSIIGRSFSLPLMPSMTR